MEPVTQEVAEKLNKLGYDDYTSHGYEISLQNCDSNLKGWLPAPSLYETLDWLREKHGIHTEIHYESIGSDERVYTYTISYLPEEFRLHKRRNVHYCYIDSLVVYGGSYSGGWDTYKEAVQQAVERAIEYLQSKV